MRYSFAAIVVVALVQLATLFSLDRPKKQDVIVWDVQEYYMYLPATFIYHDLSFKFTENLPQELKDKFWVHDTPTGMKVGKMSIGMAVMYSPFFFAGHLAALISGSPADGFSVPYQYAIFLSGFVYCLFGFFFLRKLLLRYFLDKPAALAILCIGLGTNLFYYTTTEGAMSHATLFGLFSVFIFFCDSWHRNPKMKYMTIIAITLGFAVLIRPIEILAGSIFLLYGIYDRNSIRQKIALFRKHWSQIFIAVVIGIIIGLPQLLLWKFQTGQWIYYSYGREHFFFRHPHIFKGLFGFRKGWLVYTPIMILSIIGFEFLRKFAKDFFWPVLVFFVLNVYVVLSWWSWWYGGSFGLRALVESYAILALPLAAFWQRFFMPFTARILPLVFGLWAIFLNQFQTWQYRNAIIHWDSMSEKYYWKVFLKPNYLPGSEKYLDPPDYEAAVKGEDE